jgi:hypothetical protein
VRPVPWCLLGQSVADAERGGDMMFLSVSVNAIVTA